MAEITKDEVRHVARLARLELTDDEVDEVPGAALGDPRGGLEGLGARPLRRAADRAPARDPERLGRGRARAVARARRRLPKRARPRRRPVQGAAGMTDRHADADRRGGLAARRRRGEISGAELFAAYLAAIGERDPELHAYLYAGRRSRRRRPADRGQGRDRDQGHPYDGRLEDARELRAGVRRDGRRALQGAGAARAREDEHRRVRDGLVDRELRVRPDPQPVGPDARAGRLRRRQRGGRVGGARAVGARLRHGRLDQAAGGAVRQRRPAPDLRNGLALRRRRVRLVARPGRSGREERARLRVPLLDHLGPRRERHDDGRRPSRSSCRRRRT